MLPKKSVIVSVLCAMSILMGLASKAEEDTTWHNFLVTDSSGALKINTEEEGLFPEFFFSQNKGAHRLYVDPSKNRKSYAGLWENNFITNKGWFFADSAVATGRYSYGLDDSHLFTVNFNRKIVEDRMSIVFSRYSGLSSYKNNDYKSLRFRIGFDDNQGAVQHRYGVYRNVIEVEENAGVYDKDQLESVTEVSQFSTAVKLTGANNLLKKDGVFHQQALDLTELFKEDSVIQRYHHLVGISLKFDRNQFVSTLTQADIDSSIVASPTMNFTNTYDSIGYINTHATAFYEIQDSMRKKTLALSYELIRSDWSVFNEQKICGKSRLPFMAGTELEFDYRINGLWQGGYQAKAKQRLVDGAVNFDLSAGLKSMLPNYFLLRYIGNHYDWKNDFMKENEQYLSAHAYVKKFNVGGLFTLKRYNNFVYLDTLALPVQNAESFLYMESAIYHGWQSKHLNIYSKVSYRESGNSVLRVPLFTAQQRLSYQFYLGKLRFNLGYLASYFTKYRGYAYNINTRNLYLQDKEFVGGFPIVDVFAAVQVGGAYIFAKYENLQYTAISRNYFLYPNYTVVPGMIRVGFHWTFKD